MFRPFGEFLKLRKLVVQVAQPTRNIKPFASYAITEAKNVSIRERLSWMRASRVFPKQSASVPGGLAYTLQ